MKIQFLVGNYFNNSPKSESDRMGLTTFSQVETTGFPIRGKGKNADKDKDKCKCVIPQKLRQEDLELWAI